MPSVLGYKRGVLHTLRPLKRYKAEIRLDLLSPEIRARWRQIMLSAHWAPLRALMRSLPSTAGPFPQIALDHNAVEIPIPATIDPRLLQAICQKLIPWRVGPYRIGELDIDSEWRSYMKWARVAPIIGPTINQRVADVGCSSGYFLLKLLQDKPEIALGFDPVDRCWLQCGLLQKLLNSPNLGCIPTGLSSLRAFPQFFDLIVCMGVIYHQRDPIDACKTLFSATKPGGRVFLESLVIDQPGNHVLRPADRYAKMRNAWVIPTPEALADFMEAAGFHRVKTHRFGPISTTEQRRTEWAPYESLVDFLDPHDESKTIEGHPAPYSAAVLAYRPG